MRTELWGLRNKETGELVLEYWASSQKHKALFSSYVKAEKACKWKHNIQLEPFKIDVAEVVRCEDCKYFEVDDGLKDGVLCIKHGHRFSVPKPYDYCSYGERRKKDD